MEMEIRMAFFGGIVSESCDKKTTLERWKLCSLFFLIFFQDVCVFFTTKNLQLFLGPCRLSLFVESIWALAHWPMWVAVVQAQDSQQNIQPSEVGVVFWTGS